MPETANNDLRFGIKLLVAYAVIGALSLYFWRMTRPRYVLWTAACDDSRDGSVECSDAFILLTYTPHPITGWNRDEMDVWLAFFPQPCLAACDPSSKAIRVERGAYSEREQLLRDLPELSVLDDHDHLPLKAWWEVVQDPVWFLWYGHPEQSLRQFVSSHAVEDWNGPTFSDWANTLPRKALWPVWDVSACVAFGLVLVAVAVMWYRTLVASSAANRRSRECKLLEARKDFDAWSKEHEED